MLHISSSSLAESSEHIYHSISIQQFPVCITISLTYSVRRGDAFGLCLAVPILDFLLLCEPVLLEWPRRMKCISGLGGFRNIWYSIWGLSTQFEI